MTGKNSIAGHPKYKTTGRNLIASPYQSIINQSAKDAWNEGGRPNQVFSHSKIDGFVNTLKKKKEDLNKINFETTLKGIDIPKSKELTIHTSYDQILNLSNSQLATFDTIYIDEVHTFVSSLKYRSDTIGNLIFHLLNFVACKPNCKTKIIFMSGTPSLEFLVIQELMKFYKIEHLYQTIKIDKKYKVTPKMHSIHLDTSNKVERTDAVISQIKKYLNQGRKVCHIFNRKATMDNYIRDIQTKLGNTLKIGLFYSGSKGECTENIFSGKFDDYDVVLATTYFFNGLNINFDMLSEADIKQGKTSTQKYGVVIDLGQKHTKVSVIDAIQAVNRFRNRMSDCTVFLPPIFKDDSKHPTRKFNYGAAARITLGLNRFSYPILTNSKNAKNFKLEKKEDEKRVFLREEVRKNPYLVNMRAINQLTTEEKNRQLILNKFEDKLSIYEDWFYSIDGYHYLAQEAGFLSIIKNKIVGEPLKKMTKDQIDLENKVVSNFINDDLTLSYLENHLDPKYRILVRASSAVTDPQSDAVGNFKAIDTQNGKYIIEGDFHYSHERILNRLISNHLSLAYWFGADKGIQLLRNLINPEINLLSNKSKRSIDNISMYVKQCRACTNPKNLRAKNFMRALIYLSSTDIGISKEETPLEISLTINNEKLSKLLPEMWAKQQYEMIQYNLSNSRNSEKKELQKYFTNTDQIKQQDIEELMVELQKLCIYNPLTYDKSGDIKSYETFIISKVMYSEKLFHLDIVEEESVSPELSNLTNNKKELDRFCEDILFKLNNYINPKNVPISPFLENYNKIKNCLNKKEIQNCIDLVQTLKTNTNKINNTLMAGILNKLDNDLNKLDNFLLAAFKTAEHLTHAELKNLGYNPFIKNMFLCKEDFKLESLNKELNFNLKDKSKNEIYDSIRSNDNTFIRSKRSSYDANTVKDCFIVLDKNSDILFSGFSCSKAINFLCLYGSNLKNDKFVMKDGSVPKREFNKGAYNSNTFRRDYYNNSNNGKTLKNYSIKSYPIKVQDYVDYVKSPKAKTAKKKQ